MRKIRIQVPTTRVEHRTRQGTKYVIAGGKKRVVRNYGGTKVAGPVIPKRRSAPKRKKRRRCPC